MLKRKAKKPATRGSISREWLLRYSQCSHECTEVKLLTWRDYPLPEPCPKCGGKAFRFHKRFTSLDLIKHIQENTP